MSAMTLARMRSCCSGGKGRRVGGPAADDAARAAQVRLELGVPGLMLPALGVRLREQRRWGCRHLRDRGDQGDHLALAVTLTAGDLILDDPDSALPLASCTT